MQSIKRKKMYYYAIIGLLVLTFFLTIIPGNGMSAYAARRNIKNKTFTIYNLGANTSISVFAVNDYTGAQSRGWNHGGTISVTMNQQDNGFLSVTIVMSNADVTDWTPYLNLKTSHNGYHPTGWMGGNWGGTGCEGSYEVHNLNDEWKNGECLFYIGLGFGYDQLYAQWNLVQHTVHYDANGGNGVPADQIKQFGSVLTLSGQVPTREGYIFTAWNTDPNGKGDWYSAGGLYGKDQDGGTVTLYAQWTPITYTIQFDGNGATSGSTPNQNAVFNAGGYLNTNGFKKQYGINYNGNGGTSEKTSDTADATFNGWQDNNTMYYKGMYFNYFGFDAPYYINKYPEVKAAFGYNKYAALDHWYTNSIAYGTENHQSAQNFKIDDYMRYGGSDLKAVFGTNRLAYVSHWMSNGIYEGRTGAVTVDTATSDLYPNRAWVANLATRQGENVTLTADWTPGSVTLPTATRPGYQFAGWYTSAEGGAFIGNAGKKYTPTVNGGTLYAHWIANDYQIAFDGNGATSGSMENQRAKYDMPVTLKPNEFERIGYTFTGWNTSPDGTGTSYADRQEVKNLTTEKDGIVTLYAQWRANSYIIHFDGNGATDGAMEDISVVYDQEILLPPNLFVRTTEQGESIFTGWNRDSAVYEAEFSDQDTVKNLTPEDGTVVTLYAIWDDCPQIEAVDRYFSLDFAQRGKITEEELLSTASAVDKEDGVLENRTSDQIAEAGINGSLSLYGYAVTDFTELTDSASVSMTYKAVDSIGNTVYKTVTIFIINTEPLPQTDFCYIRFINEKYYRMTYESGGLHPDSIWRNDPEYQSTLENALTNLRNDTPIEQYRIKGKTISRET